MSIFDWLFGGKGKKKATVSRTTQQSISNNRKENTASKSTTAKQIPQPEKCPYCKVLLERKPSRKKKCPHCSEYIFVRKGKLLTELQKDTYDMIKSLEEYGINKSKFMKHQATLREEFGSEPSLNDVAWRILNMAITQAKDRSDVKMINQRMASIAASEGKDPKPYLIQARRQELLSYKGLGVRKVQISAIQHRDSCEYCKSMDGKVMSLEEALSKMPLPGDCTASSGCSCMYIIADEY
jgi:hypothetical protein